MNIPVRFPSYGQDWFNFLASYGTSDHKISAVLYFNSVPDINILRRASALLLEAEPVLACKFVADNDKPEFVRHTAVDIDNYFIILPDTITPHEFISEEMNSGQMIAFGFSHNESGATLAVKLNHTCGDAGALKKCIMQLADIYTKLCGNPDYTVKPNLGDRAQKPLFDALGIENPVSLFNPANGALISNWAFPFESVKKSTEYRIAFRIINSNKFLAIKKAGKEKGATINDLILTSMFRRVFAATRPPKGEAGHIHITRDMRFYIPESDSLPVANISAMMDIPMMPDSGADFWDYLKQVKGKVAEAIEQKKDIHNCIGCEYVGTIGYKAMAGYFTGAWEKGQTKGVCSPMLSNLGILAKYPIMFGDHEVTDACMLPPAFHAPALMLSPSCYNNVLTLAIGYYKGEHRTENIESLLDGIVEELSELAANQISEKCS
jgi:NRPS condensation-like uncharacterized protein